MWSSKRPFGRLRTQSIPSIAPFSFCPVAVPSKATSNLAPSTGGATSPAINAAKLTPYSFMPVKFKVALYSNSPTSIVLITAPNSLGNARYTLLDFRHGVELDLIGPRSIDSPQTRPGNGANIGRQVRDKHVVTAKYQAVRPEKTYRRAIFIDAAEVAQFGDDSALLRLEHHNLVGLIAGDPEIVVLVDNDPVWSSAGAVNENLGLTSLERRAAHRNFDDRVLRGVGNEHRRLLVIERDAICADRGRWPCWLEERALDPDLARAAFRSNFPDQALVRVGDVQVSGIVEGQSVEAGMLAGNCHEDRRSARLWIDREHFGVLVIDHDQLPILWMEAKIQQHSA